MAMSAPFMHSRQLVALPILILAAVSLAGCSGTTEKAAPPGADNTAPAPDTSPEGIRRRNSDLLAPDLSEDRVKADLVGKVIQAYGPEEGEARLVDAAWRIEASEFKGFVVQKVDPAATAIEILVTVVLDDAPKSKHRIEGDVQISYEKQGNDWKIVRLRRAGGELKYQK